MTLYLSLKKKEARKKHAYKTLDDLRDDEKVKTRYKKAAYLDECELTNGKLRTYLKREFEGHPRCWTKGNPEGSNLKRLVRMLDFMEYREAVLKMLRDSNLIKCDE